MKKISILTGLVLLISPFASAKMFDKKYEIALHELRPGCVVKYRGAQVKYVDRRQNRPAPTVAELRAVDVLALAKIEGKARVLRERKSRILEAYSMENLLFVALGLLTTAETEMIGDTLRPIIDAAARARADIDKLKTVAEVEAFVW